MTPLLNKPTYETPEGYEQLIAAHEAEEYWAGLDLQDERRTRIVADLLPCEL